MPKFFTRLLLVLILALSADVESGPRAGDAEAERAQRHATADQIHAGRCGD